MSGMYDWYKWLSEEQQRTIDSQKETIAGIGDFLEYQINRDAEKYVALEQKAQKLLDIAINLVTTEGWESEKFENWPKGWPIQDEQGGCVLCGGHPKGKPLGQPELKDHSTDCAFRMAYDFLKEIKNENGNAN